MPILWSDRTGRERHEVFLLRGAAWRRGRDGRWGAHLPGLRHRERARGAVLRALRKFA
jgi:hypothetical protein